MDKIKSVIIDDEAHARILLHEVINRFVPEIEVLDQASDLESGVALIRKTKPEIVFLDIEMPGKNGLRIMEEYGEEVDFQIIFVTAYNQYTIEALRMSALDYLLKPINPEDLKQAIQRYLVGSNRSKEDQFDTLSHNMAHPDNQKIILNTHGGRFVVNLEEIMFLQAEGQYTRFKLSKEQEIMASKPLSHFEKMLTNSFHRIHRSYLINENYIDYNAPVRNLVLLTNGVEIPVSRQKKKELEQLFVDRK